jgi:hypothetical protein
VEERDSACRAARALHRARSDRHGGVGQTSGRGRELLIDENAFIEQLLPSSIVRKLTVEKKDAYRRLIKASVDHAGYRA